MKKSWENDTCEQIKAYYTSYSVPQAALLWSGVPPEQIDEHLQHAEPTSNTNEYGRHVLRIPYLSCFEARCRAIQDAINDSRLKVGRDGGETFFAQGQQVAYSRRTVKRNDLKEWIASEFPADKPAFLFDEIERNTHPLISTEAYQALIAERDMLKQRIENATVHYRDLKTKNDELTKRNSMLENLSKSQSQNERQKMLRLIYGMAMDAYGFNPLATKNKATGENNGSIKAALDRHGINIDADTIRGYLVEAKELLPPPAQ